MSFDIYDGQQQVDETLLVLFVTYDPKGAKLVYPFTTSSTAVTATPTVLVDVETVFEPEALSVGKVTSPVVGSTSNVNFTFGPDNEMAKKMALGEFNSRVEVAIIKIDPDGDMAVRWRGTSSRSIYSPTKIEVTCISIMDTLRNKLRPRIISPFCPWGVYSTQCGADLYDPGYAPFFTSYDVAAGTILVDEILNFPASDFVGGMVAVSVEAVSYIQASEQVGQSYLLTLSNPSILTSITTEVSVTVGRGCDKTAETCVTRFNRGESYGGFTSIPRETVIRG